MLQIQEPHFENHWARAFVPQNVESSGSSPTWKLVRNETLSTHTGLLNQSLHFNEAPRCFLCVWEVGEALLEQRFSMGCTSEISGSLKKKKKALTSGPHTQRYWYWWLASSPRIANLAAWAVAVMSGCFKSPPVILEQSQRQNVLTFVDRWRFLLSLARLQGMYF